MIDIKFDGVKTSSKAFTGFCKAKPVLINPNKAELNAIGVNVKEDPSYSKFNDEGVATTRVDIYFKLLIPGEDKLYSKVSIFTENRVQSLLSKKGDTWTTYVNSKGEFAASKDGLPSYDWFSQEGAVPAFVREEQVSNFVKMLLGSTGLNAPFTKLDMEKISKGDVTQLKSILYYIHSEEMVNKLLPELASEVAKVKASGDFGVIEVLLTVRENGFYQSIFNDYFGDVSGRSRSYFHKNEKKQADNAYRLVKELYSHELAEFKGFTTPGLVDPISTNVPKEVTEVVSQGSGATLSTLFGASNDIGLPNMGEGFSELEPSF